MATILNWQVRRSTGSIVQSNFQLGAGCVCDRRAQGCSTNGEPRSSLRRRLNLLVVVVVVAKVVGRRGRGLGRQAGKLGVHAVFLGSGAVLGRR